MNSFIIIVMCVLLMELIGFSWFGWGEGDDEVRRVVGIDEMGWI